MALASQKLQEKPITSIHLWLNLQEILQDLHKSCRPHLHNVVHVQLYANEVISCRAHLHNVVSYMPMRSFLTSFIIDVTCKYVVVIFAVVNL